MQTDTGPEEVGLSSPPLARISQWMRQWVDSGRLPGLLVAIVRDDRLAWFEACGYRDVEAGRAVEPNTLYRLYSMTKPITTVAALMLYEEGRFQLDDPIAKYIPAFAETRVFAHGDVESFETEPLARPITVHDLMTHTSGNPQSSYSPSLPRRTSVVWSTSTTTSGISCTPTSMPAGSGRRELPGRR